MNAKEKAVLLSQRLTERDLNMLNVFKRHKIVSRDHLIYLSGLHIRSQAKNIINKRLRVMNKIGFIEKTQPYCPPGQGSFQQLISLGKEGARYLGIPYKSYFKKTSDMVRNNTLEPPSDYLHRLHLVDMEIIIRKKCEEYGYDLIYLTFEEDNKVGELVPDMFVILAKDGIGKPIYLEMDRGTESQNYVKGKLVKYRNAKLSGSWKVADWVKQFNNPPFPYLLFVTTGSQQRIDFVNEQITLLQLKGSCTTLDDLEEHLKIK